MFIFPYNAGSESAKALAEELNIKRIRRENSKFKPSPNKTVINWGASKLPDHIEGCQIINTPEAVALASNKTEAFTAMSNSGVTVPPFTTEKQQAEQWIIDGNSVVCRTVLNGHSGEGIVLADSMDQLVDAPLYTMYVKKKHEFRIHVAFDRVIDSQRKARNRDNMDEEVNWRIRNLDNGFIFVRENINVPLNVTEQARQSVSSLGLDFGAADIIYNVNAGVAYVLEVNTAPGLKGTTLNNYANSFRDYDAGMFDGGRVGNRPFVMPDWADQEDDEWEDQEDDEWEDQEDRDMVFIDEVLEEPARPVVNTDVAHVPNFEIPNVEMELNEVGRRERPRGWPRIDGNGNIVWEVVER